MRKMNFSSQLSVSGAVIKFFLSLAACLLIFGHTASAADMEFQAGFSALSISSSKEHDNAATIMPAIALTTHLDQFRTLKLELGFLNYSTDKKGDKYHKILSDGKIGVKASSIAGILSTRAIRITKLRQMKFNAGFGIVNYKYDNSMSSEIENYGDQPGLTKINEKINAATGIQLIIGMDFILWKNFILTLDTRYISVKPETVSYFNDRGEIKIKKERADFSHTWVGLNLMYLFGL